MNYFIFNNKKLMKISFYKIILESMEARGDTKIISWTGFKYS